MNRVPPAGSYWPSSDELKPGDPVWWWTKNGEWREGSCAAVEGGKILVDASPTYLPSKCVRRRGPSPSFVAECRVVLKLSLVSPAYVQDLLQALLASIEPPEKPS